MAVEAKELLKAGQLLKAREQLIALVKATPADLALRTLLFQTLVFCGEWDKAERHLDALVQQDSKVETGVQVYKNLLHAEKERLDVMTQGRRPSFLPESPAYLEAYLSAWQQLSENRPESAKELFEQINRQVQHPSGNINGKPFTGFADTDQLLSRFLEIFTFERYVLIPFESIRELIIEAPKTLFDLIWIGAQVTTWGGLNINCYLPVLYPGSYLHDDERVKLGRMTDWQSLGGGYTKASGQHVYQVGSEEVSLLEIREIIFSASQ